MSTAPCVALAALFLLTACGGGGGGDQTTDDALHGNINRGNPSDLGYRQFDIRLADGRPVASINVGENQISQDMSVLPRGFFDNIAAQMEAVDENGGRSVEKTVLRGYRGFHSGTFFTAPPERLFPQMPPAERAAGIKSQVAHAYGDLPMGGTFTYRGYAFNNNPANDAALTYHIDFGSRRGHGEIAASRSRERMILGEEPIRYHSELIANTSGYGVGGGDVETVQGQDIGTYKLLIAGPNAEEIIGEADYRQNGAAQQLILQGAR